MKSRTLARIKVKIGQNEIEVDSRDFYVDNQTFGDVINSIIQALPTSQDDKVQITSPHLQQEVTDKTELQQQQQQQRWLLQSEVTTVGDTSSKKDTTKYLGQIENDVEVFEPEFDEPKPIELCEIGSKLHMLEHEGFFDVRRTVSETVSGLRTHGWEAYTLDVSKMLAYLSTSKQMTRTIDENGAAHYITKRSIVAV